MAEAGRGGSVSLEADFADAGRGGIGPDARALLGREEAALGGRFALPGREMRRFDAPSVPRALAIVVVAQVKARAGSEACPSGPTCDDRPGVRSCGMELLPLRARFNPEGMGMAAGPSEG